LALEMPLGVCHLHGPVSEYARRQTRDDKLWKQEFTWASQHGVNKMQCPCTKCEGKGYPLLLHIVCEHLIANGRHPLFRVWKVPGLLDDFDEEWVANMTVSH